MIIATLLIALVATLASAASNTTSSGSSYRKVEEYSGSSFFEGFTWFNETDPTNGFVEYVQIDTSATNNLTAFVLREEMVDVNSYVGVDFQQKIASNFSAGMNSVRLLSKATFDVGLLAVIDVLHAPTGPGVWPAVWLIGNVSNTLWPNAGEIDIMEWVNDDSENHVTLHTAPGCVVNQDQGAASGYLGTLASSDCNAQSGHEGCSITAPRTITSSGHRLATAGAPFNAQGGGVYVMEWTETGITAWLFPRDQIPQDLNSESPNPSQWIAKPMARFSGTGCDYASMFQQQQLVINIDLCGDWAGNVWNMSMAQKTGIASCEAYVAAHSESFQDAFFEFASIKMFSSNPNPPGLSKDHPGSMKVRRSDGVTEHDCDRAMHVQLHQRGGAPFLNSTTTGLTSLPRPALPSSTSTTRPLVTSKARREGCGYMWAAFLALVVAALI